MTKYSELEKRLDSILASSPLLAQTDREKLHQLRDGLIEHFEPQSLIDRMDIDRLAEHLAEIHWAKQQISAVIAGAKLISLAQLIPSSDEDTKLSIATNYYSNNSDKRRIADERLDEYNILPEHIRGNAINRCRQSIATLEGMIARREKDVRLIEQRLRKESMQVGNNNREQRESTRRGNR